MKKMIHIFRSLQQVYLLPAISVVVLIFAMIGSISLPAQTAVEYSTIVSHPIDAANTVSVVEDNGKLHWFYVFQTALYYRQIDEATGNTIVGPLVKASGAPTFGTFDVKVSGGNVYVAGVFGGDFLYLKMDAATGSTLFTETIPISTGPLALDVANGKVYIAIAAFSSGFPGAAGMYNEGADMVYVRYDAASNAREFATYIGSSGNDFPASLQYSGGDLIVGLRCNYVDFPVTNGSVNAGGHDIVYARLNAANGAILCAGYIGSTAGDVGRIMELNGEVFVFAGTAHNTYPSTVGPTGTGTIAAITKLDRATANIIFSRHLPPFGGSTPADMELHGGVLYLTIAGNGGIDNGSFHKVSASDGSLLFSKTLSVNPSGGMIKDGDRLIFVGSALSRLPTYNFEWAVSKLSDATGQELFRQQGGDIDARNNITHAFLTGDNLNFVTRLADQVRTFPTTDGSKKVSDGTNAIAYTNLDLCPSGWSTGADALSPSTQTVCQNALVDEIQGQAITIPSGALPPVYLNGVLLSQPAIEALYQWQEATAPGGPWVNIPGAVFQNYSPSPIVTTRYFRRLAFNHPCCGSTLISTSQVASVVVNGFMAPTVNAGGVYNTCPGVSVTLNATVTGGTAPYTLDWDQGAMVRASRAGHLGLIFKI